MSFFSTTTTQLINTLLPSSGSVKSHLRWGYWVPLAVFRLENLGPSTFWIFRVSCPPSGRARRNPRTTARPLQKTSRSAPQVTIQCRRTTWLDRVHQHQVLKYCSTRPVRHSLVRKRWCRSSSCLAMTSSARPPPAR